MNCPHCQNPQHRTVETRASPYGIRRRHRCACGLTFTSYNGAVVVKNGNAKTAVALAIVRGSV